MEWVHSFYEKQFEMMKEMKDAEDDSAQLKLLSQIENQIEKPFESLLELGAGSGEFAIAAAKKGYSVTAIELVPKLVQEIVKNRESTHLRGSLSVIQGDFLKIDLEEQFDVICYLDGFGVGEDAEQITLLKRIESWLKPNGSAFIDIYTPWYWAKASGQEMKIGQFHRKYGFDFIGNRMLDTWSDPLLDNESYTQTLRCYSPQDLSLLLNETGLEIESITPGGSMDYDAGVYNEKVELGEAMSYMVKIKRK